MVKITKLTATVKAPKKVKKVKEVVAEVKEIVKPVEVSKYEEFMAKVDFLLVDVARFERTTLSRQEINAIAQSVLI